MDIFVGRFEALPTGPTSAATGSPRALLAIVNLSPALDVSKGEKKSRAQFATLGSDIDVSAPNYIVDSDDGGPHVRVQAAAWRHEIQPNRLPAGGKLEREEEEEERNQPEKSSLPPRQWSPTGLERSLVTWGIKYF